MRVARHRVHGQPRSPNGARLPAIGAGARPIDRRGRRTPRQIGASARSRLCDGLRLATLLPLLGIGTSIAGCRGETTPPEKPPIPVQVASVERAQAVQASRYSATIIPASQVPVAFKTSGYVDTLLQVRGSDRRVRDLQQGDLVRRGQVLAHVQQTDYRARVQQADARVQQATATVTKARQDLDRAEQLFAVRSLTQPDLDAARLQHEFARAQLSAAQADVSLAQSALRDTALAAPLAAVVLEKRIERGSLAAPGSVAFVLGDVRSVKAQFGVPDTIVRTLAPGTLLSLASDALPGRTFSGRITSVAPSADVQTRVFGVEVTIPNADAALKPGMIATVQLDEAVRGARSSTEAVLTVPLTAIVKQEASAAASAPTSTSASASADSAASASAASPAPASARQADGSRGGASAAANDSADFASSGSGYAVFAVEAGTGDREIARLRRVTVGDVVGNAIEVTGGLRAGERVITTGATLVKDGDRVRVIP